MKTVIPEQINSEAEARAFLKELVNNYEDFHPDDYAADTVNQKGERLFTDEEAEKIDTILGQCSGFLPEPEDIYKVILDFCFIRNNKPDNTKFKIEISQPEIIEDSLKKIAVFCEIFLPTKISGIITPTEVNLDFKGRHYTISLNGKIKEGEEELRAHAWDGNMCLGSMDFHPRNEMGELDIEQFREEVKGLTQ